MVKIMNVCSKCGRVLTGGIVFCDSCGARAVSQSNEQPQNPTPQQQNYAPQPPQNYAPPPQNYAPTPPNYNHPPQSYAPPPQTNDYNPAQQNQFVQPVPAGDTSGTDNKENKKKTTILIVLNIVFGFIGYIIAANMYTFGIGEILMIIAMGLGIAIRKPIGFILAGIDLFMMLDLWFFGIFL